MIGEIELLIMKTDGEIGDIDLEIDIGLEKGINQEKDTDHKVEKTKIIMIKRQLLLDL